MCSNGEYFACEETYDDNKHQITLVSVHIVAIAVVGYISTCLNWLMRENIAMNLTCPITCITACKLV